jgi:hypothetical protein
MPPHGAQWHCGWGLLTPGTHPARLVFFCYAAASSGCCGYAAASSSPDDSTVANAQGRRLKASASVRSRCRGLLAGLQAQV